MTGTRPGNGPDHGEEGSWASETLPLVVRKQLLESDLKKLGSRKAEAARLANVTATHVPTQQEAGSAPAEDAAGRGA